MQRIVEIDGDFWPSADTECRPAVLKYFNDVDLAIAQCRKTDIVIQAGGNCGIWARYLAKTFSRVYTFEPDNDNFQCLVRNAPDENIVKMQVALGLTSGMASLRRTPENAGAHYINPVSEETGRHAVQMISIDQLRLPDCDLIQLDIEGYEYFALIGAQKTIRKYRPVLMLEDKKHGKRYGFLDGDIDKTLKDWGYELFMKVNRDIIMVPACK